MRLLVEHCREGDDLGFGYNRSKDFGGTLAIETGELVVEDDEVRLFVKRDRNGFDPVRASPTTSMSSASQRRRRA
jgi:hypothetical protein